MKKMLSSAVVLTMICAWADLERGMLVLNQDPTEFQARMPAEKMTEEGAKEYFDLVNIGRNTHFFICPNAHCAYYDSKVWDTCYRTDPNLETPSIPQVTNTKLLMERGVDYVRIWIDRSRQKGISPWLSQRMNDVHNIGALKTCSTSSFWLKHPEYRRVPGFDRKGDYPWEPAAYDFQHKAVRDHTLALAREMLERWDVDGFECDWQRFRHHLSPEIEKRGDGAKYLTMYMREMRKLVDEISAKRGKKILLGARVCSRMAAAKGLGMDAVAWAKEGLVDWVISGAFFTTNDYGQECEEFRAALLKANPKVKFIVSFDRAGVMLDPRDYGLYGANRAQCAGFFERMYAEGVRDFYGFNFFRYNPGDQSMKFLQKDGIPNERELRAEARAYPLTFCDSLPAGMKYPHALPMDLSDGVNFPIKIGKAGEPSEVHLQMAFDREVDSRVLDSVSLNGIKAIKRIPVDVKGWLRPRNAKIAPRLACRFYFPIGAVKDKVNKIAVMPAKGVCIRAVELFLGPKVVK